MKNAQFRIQYLILPRLNRGQIEIRNKITSACQVSTATFYNWVQGITAVPDRYKFTIANIMNIDVDVLFPEK